MATCIQEIVLALSISIAMCTYNGAQFLPEQLDTIARQSRLPDELVICDDRSSDGSAETIVAFSRRAPFPVRVVVNEQNLGSTKNFEKAIALSQGDVVALSDQDDAWHEDKLARLEKAFVADEVVAAFSDADLIDDNSKLGELRLWKLFSFSHAEQELFASGHALKVLIRHPVVTGAAMAFRRNLFNLLTPIPSQDVHDRWMSFLLAACGAFALIREPLMRYRLHHNQQIGVGAVTFGERLTRARNTGEDLYLAEISRFRQLQSRLDNCRTAFPYAQQAIEQIERKVAHLQHRIQLRQVNGRRLPRILREIRNHGYWDYSAGWESIAKDLFAYGHASS